jgi:general secretion pathway protein J
MQRRNSRKGFTLLEILIAMLIFTIVSVIMAHALHTIIESNTGTEKRAAQLAELQIATLLLSRDIEQCIDRPILNGKKIQEKSLQGTVTRLSLTHGGVANPGGDAIRSTLQRSDFIFESHRLVRQIWTVLDQTETSVPQQRELLSNVKDLQFDYLDAKGFFHNTWPPLEQDKSPPLPAAVRITMTLKNWGKFTQLYIIPAKTVEVSNE